MMEPVSVEDKAAPPFNLGTMLALLSLVAGVCDGMEANTAGGAATFWMEFAELTKEKRVGRLAAGLLNDVDSF